MSAVAGRALRVITVLALAGSLAACSDTANPPVDQTGSPGSHEESAPIDARWEDPGESGINGTFNVIAMVDPDGTSEYGSGLVEVDASDPGRPVSTGPDGSIYAIFSLTGTDVFYSLTEAYISSDAKGDEVGPAIDCLDVTAEREVNVQMFECTVRFVDQENDTGTYYGVFRTNSTKVGSQLYNAREVIVPFHTKPTN